MGGCKVDMNRLLEGENMASKLLNSDEISMKIYGHTGGWREAQLRAHAWAQSWTHDKLVKGRCANCTTSDLLNEVNRRVEAGENRKILPQQAPI